MCDAQAVGFVEGVGDFRTQSQDLLGGHSAFFDARGERFAFDKFHDEKIGAGFAADVVERADVGMI